MKSAKNRYPLIYKIREKTAALECVIEKRVAGKVIVKKTKVRDMTITSRYPDNFVILKNEYIIQIKIIYFYIEVDFRHSDIFISGKKYQMLMTILIILYLFEKYG